MIKKNSVKPRRYNPKDSGSYQKQIPLPYGTQKFGADDGKR
jgi:hypothetical protein